jgi:hypothetical protein
MKSYILLPPEPVQSQITTVAARTQASVLFVGLDVHNESIAVSLAPSDTTEVRRYGIIGGEHDDVLKLVKKLQATHPGTLLKFCYEAGSRGLPVSLKVARFARFLDG